MTQPQTIADLKKLLESHPQVAKIEILPWSRGMAGLWWTVALRAEAGYTLATVSTEDLATAVHLAFEELE